MASVFGIFAFKITIKRLIMDTGFFQTPLRIITFVILFLPRVLSAQLSVSSQPSSLDDWFALVDQTSKAILYVDAHDDKVVHKTAELFSADVERITGKPLLVQTDSKRLRGHVVILGTLGKNALIDKLIADKKLVVDSLQHQWERFHIQTIKNPIKGVEQALVIVGSDRRGTAYGAFTLSERMGGKCDSKQRHQSIDVFSQSTGQAFLETFLH